MSENQKKQWTDQELGMDRAITRRDFLDGVAVAVGALGLAGNASAATQFAQDAPGYYPPALTGMRGSHDGSFDIAHGLRDGSFWQTAGTPKDTGETYDLIVVGGGISGLAAAYFYRERNPAARILILDNHDDFGGHAKRNEFTVGGRMLLANGGTAEIDSPFDYSKEAHGLMVALGIDPVALSEKAGKASDRKIFHDLHSSVFFDQETFGKETLVVGAPRRRGRGAGGMSWKEFMSKTPMTAEAQSDMVRLQESKVDYLPGLSDEEKKVKLSKISYKEFLLTLVKVHPQVVSFYQASTQDLYGLGIDAVGALECWALEYPGFEGMHIERKPTTHLSFTALGEVTPKKEYFFHYPDGNASVARLLVRSLIPEAMPGSTAEDVVMARANYAKLDCEGAKIRVRLSSTAARVKQTSDTEVEVVYGREKQLYSTRAKGVVMACWNMMIPYVCPQLPAKQKEALHYGVKVPLVYTTVAVRNWRAFQKLGVQQISAPGMYHTRVNLELPTVIGGYNAQPKSVDDPALIRMLRTPCKPGLPARDQQREGHIELFMTPFSTFEQKIREQLVRMLGAGGFDPAHDIEAITVNRWPHGYAYEYTPLWDGEVPVGQRPCDIARKPFGRITIANSDAAGAAYTDQAMDQAYRAVRELTV
jgi:spermidine dehydrogenase